MELITWEKKLLMKCTTWEVYCQQHKFFLLIKWCYLKNLLSTTQKRRRSRKDIHEEDIGEDLYLSVKIH